MNINSHIEKYLENYLKLDKPEFAILLSGKWGSGKTYFIDKFIEKNQKKDEFKFIKISLFGLKEVDSIDEQIFQNLHPFLGNKYVKLTGNIAKNALKFGIKLDWNDDNKSDGTANTDLSKFNPLDFFSDEKKSKIKIIFVFDDLERTDIELIEVLGYINYLVEQSAFNAIILANEEKLIEEEVKNESSKYIEFKEKVIGKTFEVQHDFDQILISLISENTDKSKQYLNSNKDIIKNVYFKAEHYNLRHIKQILLDFEYFSKEIDDKYLDNKEFMPILINNFFALSIELKSGSLKEKELYDKSNYMFDENKEKTNVTKIYEKYNIKNTALFSGKGWVRVLLKNSLNGENINHVIGDLSFFIEEKKNVQSSWVRLWYYWKLEDDEFIKVLDDVLNKFRNCSYEKPEHFLHVIALLVYFNKNKLFHLSIEDIEDEVKKCIERYKNTSTWKDTLFDDMYYNNTGLGYMGEEDEDFRRLHNLIKKENEKVYSEEIKIKEKNKLQTLVRAINEWDEEFIKKLLLDEYESKPIFNNLSAKRLTEQINKISNNNIKEFGYILHARYSENKSLNGRKYYCYLTEELPFWKEMKKEFELLNTSKGLKKYLLQQFENYGIDKIIKKLENCNKGN